MKVLIALALFAAVARATPVYEDDESYELPFGAAKLYPSNLTAPVFYTDTRSYAKYSICGGDGTIKLEGLQVPYKISLPGQLPINIALAELTTRYDNLIVSLSLAKKIAFIWTPIPCISDIGSCTYKDICALLAKAMEGGEENVVKFVTDAFGIPIGNLCPFLPLKIENVGVQFDLPKLEIGGALQGLVEFLGSGKYRAKVTVYDYNSPKRVIFCLNVDEVELKM